MSRSSDRVDRKLSEALRAQASGLSTGSPMTPMPPPGPASGGSPGRGPTHAKPSLPAWAVLALAVLLGAAAGGLAGVISTW